MLIEALNESIARNRELSKSGQVSGLREPTAANAHAVAMPLKKSAEVDRRTFLTAFRVMQLSL